MGQFIIRPRVPDDKNLRADSFVDNKLHVDFSEKTAYIKSTEGGYDISWVQFTPEGIQDVITTLQIVHKYMTDEKFREEHEYDLQQFTEI